jgi:rfaE bifunctional protein kinase chain/domain
MMENESLASLLSAIPRARIGVLGDFCLDAYWTVDESLSEVSVETGLATRPVRAERCSLGGAGNVVNNLRAMGVGRVSAFCVLGDDLFGREMTRILSALDVDTRGVLVQETGWSTPVYIKPVAGGTEQARIDFGNANAPDPRIGEALLQQLRDSLAALDLVVINQQLLHGIHAEAFRRGLVGLVRGARIPFICDSRDFNDGYDGTLRKLNDREALRLCGKAWESDAPVPLAEAERAAEVLFARWTTPVFLTRGPRGILVRDARGAYSVPGLRTFGRIDTVGAGDSALAGIAAALAVGRDGREAATLGNLVAGVTVRKLFTTGTASPEEIRAIGADADYVFNPELADDARAARFHPSSEIEIVTAPPRPAARVTHAIFDNDGTLSTLREGWEEIMEPVMIQAILGPGWKTVDQVLFDSVRGRVRDYIDATTGVQTLVQMHGLVEMVREYGLVPAADVKDAKGYKAIYNAEIVAMAARRLRKIERGELAAEDYMVKGALPLLAALRAAGVKIHLASGTDEPDVVSEARALGYADAFDGGIHGAVGDIAVEAKRVVLERIMAEIGGRGARPGADDPAARHGTTLVTFGDGPVEMRETKRRGGYTVGVASDEPRRYGWNMRKRSRLIKAGADLVVPDFTQWKTLLGLLGVPVVS